MNVTQTHSHEQTPKKTAYGARRAVSQQHDSVLNRTAGNHNTHQVLQQSHGAVGEPPAIEVVTLGEIPAEGQASGSVLPRVHFILS